MQKNVASQKIKVFAFDLTDNTPKTGDAANITVKVSNDWAAAGALTDINPTEVEDGYYVFDVTQAESNYDNIDVYPESSTADIQVVGCPSTIVTVPENHADLGIESDGDLTKVNTLDGHTAQTGNSYPTVNTNLDATVSSRGTADPGDLMGLANDAITSAKYDESTAFPVKSDDSGATQIARVGADGDTLETLSDQIDAVPTAAENVNEWETQSQADPTGFHVNVLEVNGTGQTANDNGADINTILSRIIGTLAAGTHEPQSGDAYAIVNSGVFGNSALKTLIDALNDISAADILTTALTESYAADGATFTLSQALYMIWSLLAELEDVDTTTPDSKQLDGVSVAMSFLTNNAANPTNITRTA